MLYFEVPGKDYKFCEKIHGSMEYFGAICTKYTRNLFTETMQSHVNNVVTTFFEKQNDLTLLDVQTTRNTIVLSFRCHGKQAAAKVIQTLRKTIGTNLRETFPELKTKVPTLWSPDIFLSTCGKPSLEELLEYTVSQKQEKKRIKGGLPDVKKE